MRGPQAIFGNNATRDSDPLDLRPDEELWVIERSDPKFAPAPRGENDPGCGGLVCRPPSQDREVPLPLRHTDVKASVSGYIATVDVTQQFHNPYDGKIEAVYVFPLPHNAAVNEFIMTIGDRRIRGIIRERQEAERIYYAAREQGHVASLLTQERPNLFTQRIANIEPGRSIDVNIRYLHTLEYVDGWFEFVFPMVVGPRFNPPYAANGVGTVGRGNSGASGQAVEVAYLNPGERSGHDIAVQVELAAGVSVEEIVSPSHAVRTRSISPHRAIVNLGPADRIPNKDFVLRYRVAGDRMKSAFLTHRDRTGDYFTLMLFPPRDLSTLPRMPKEMIFVLDCSGSMRGEPLAKSKTAIERVLRRLEPGDTFQVINFSNSAAQLGASPLPATPENVRRGLDYVRNLRSEGGTMMITGIRAALDFPHDPERRRIVSFLTDGFIGNEDEIFAEIHRGLGSARIFSFGIGSSVNRHLIEGMARIGRGAVAYVGLDESAGSQVDLFYERFGRPAMTDIAVDWGGLRVSDVYPRRIPDLVVGRPVILTGRCEGRGTTTLRITGRAGGDRPEARFNVDPGNPADTHPGIPFVWARKQIEVLEDAITRNPSPELTSAVRDLALRHGLVSTYTAYVAVDATRVTTGDHGTTVPVAVPVPEGVKYETTVK